MSSPAYFLIAVSNRPNLDLCIKYGLAGFTSSNSGVWTFCDVQAGDYVSFLYGARAHNLYEVRQAEAIADADALPPWPPLTFAESGLTYYFAFRLHLNLIREFEESLVRPEFAYVAENLLLRAGYRKTHFQADQTTLQNVSEMGSLSHTTLDELQMPAYSTFTPSFTRTREAQDVPQVFGFREVILQSALRHYLTRSTNLSWLLNMLCVQDLQSNSLEILSEKAIPEGHVDLLIKESVPIGMAKKIVVEVKLSSAKPGDILQLEQYMAELGAECVGGILIAERFPKSVIERAQTSEVRLVRYSLPFDWERPKNFEEIKSGLTLEAIP